jgi:hypothetical protein
MEMTMGYFSCVFLTAATRQVDFQAFKEFIFMTLFLRGIFAEL